MIRNREFNNDIYDVILFEYWRQSFVKVMKRKLPLYYFKIENEDERRPRLSCRDLASRRLTKEDIQINEQAIIVIAIKKTMNLYLYDYLTERLTYVSCDKKEH